MEELKSLYKRHTYAFLFVFVFVTLISFIAMVVKWPITGIFAFFLVFAGLICHLIVKLVMSFITTSKK